MSWLMKLTHINQKTQLVILCSIERLECLNEETTHLWLNSKRKKSDNKPQILSGNALAESVVAEVGTLGHLHLKVCSTSVAAFRILLVILPNFV